MTDLLQIVESTTLDAEQIAARTTQIPTKSEFDAVVERCSANHELNQQQHSTSRRSNRVLIMMIVRQHPKHDLQRKNHVSKRNYSG